jgi:hypothetical protein
MQSGVTFNTFQISQDVTGKLGGKKLTCDERRLVTLFTFARGYTLCRITSDALFMKLVHINSVKAKREKQ